MRRWRPWLLAFGFGLSLFVVILFGLRSLRFIHRLHEQEPIQPWMSVPYIARTRHVPAEILYQALNLPVPLGRDRRPLSVIAREQDRPVENVIAVLQATVDKYRAALGTPTPPPIETTPGAFNGAAP